MSDTTAGPSGSDGPAMLGHSHSNSQHQGSCARHSDLTIKWYRGAANGLNSRVDSYTTLVLEYPLSTKCSITVISKQVMHEDIDSKKKSCHSYNSTSIDTAL